jgi:hypothetical protein
VQAIDRPSSFGTIIIPFWIATASGLPLMLRFFTECHLPLLLLDGMDMGMPRYFIDVAMVLVVLVVLLALRGAAHNHSISSHS